MNAKDNLGQPISHLMSNRVIKISKQHGIITPCRFNNFPDDTTQFKLSGRTLLTQRDIFNFNVGDFFQWDGTQRSGVANFVHTYEQTQVFSKDSSADSIKYVIDYTYYRITHILPNTYYLYGHDTDTIVYAFNQPSTLDLIPNKFYSLGLGNSYGVDEQLSDSAYYHDRSMKQESKYYVYDAFQNCISEGIFDCGFWDYFYAEGLGIVRIFDYTQFPFCYDYQMVYYNKGSETWGTPLNWSLILSANEIGKNDFKIFPNPFNDVLNIEFPDFKNDPSKIEITDVNGRLVKSLDSEEQQDLKIFTGDMKPGFYLLKIELGNNSFHYKLLKN